jgi:UDP-N-acetylglucosamine 2-epimerase (non-hydrolysing)
MIQVMTVYGTRPEAVKLGPVIRAMQDDPELEPVVVLTGQHRSMLDQVNEVFGISADADLNILTPGQTLAQVTTRALEGLNEVIAARKPDAILVQGDTTTTFVGALAAFYHKVPVVHVEAGLRTFDVLSPYPEEMNRRLTTQLTTLHLAATATSRANLLAENVPADMITVTGNTVIDALLWTVSQKVDYGSDRLDALEQRPERVVVVTAHRRESWGAPMRSIGD